MAEEKKEQFQSRPPDFRISGLNKRTGDKGELGAAWKNSDGSVTLRFNPFIALPPISEMVITLWPSDPKKRKPIDASTELITASADQPAF